MDPEAELQRSSEAEVERERHELERIRHAQEAEARLLDAHPPAGEAVQVHAQESSDAAALREEARLLGQQDSRSEAEAENQLLRTPTPEQQELHKSPETIPEKEAGGPHRPSWDSSPDASEKHLVPDHALQGVDDHIARWAAEDDSRIQGRELTDRDLSILKGDAGEGRTYADLLGRYERQRILHQPRFEDPDRVRTPDFAVQSDRNPGRLAEIVDSKAWSLTRPRDAQGSPVADEEFFRHLQQKPDASSVINTAELESVVEKYASSPRLEPDGRVVLYFPEDVHRFAPQVKHELEGWSHTEVAHGRVVEVRSMGVSQEDLRKDWRTRRGG
jgi:hypothetical protein